TGNGGVAGAHCDQTARQPIVREGQRCGEEAADLEASGGLEQLQLEPATLVQRDERRVPDKGPGPAGCGPHLVERDHGRRWYRPPSAAEPGTPPDARGGV